MDISTSIIEAGGVATALVAIFIVVRRVMAPIRKLHYFLDDQPHISDGGHLAELARRYPEGKLICAHVCGGGDWESKR